MGRGIAAVGRSMGRAVGRTRELDPAHRRDGLGVALLVLAVISAAGVWFGAGGPVGRALTTGVGYVIGLACGAAAGAAGAGRGGADGGHPATRIPRPRIAVGSLLLALGVLGLVHLAAGRPDEPARWAEGGGAIGYLAATPLATGLTVWVAGAGAGAAVRLRVTGAHRHPGAPGAEPDSPDARPRGRPDAAAEPEAGEAAAGSPDPAPTAEPAPLRRPSRRRQASRVADVYREGERGRRRDPTRAGRRSTGPARSVAPPPAAVPATPPAEPVPARTPGSSCG